MTLNRIAWILVIIILLGIAYEAVASGYFPEPVYTDDPAGNLGPEAMYQVACEVYDEHQFEPFEDGVIVMIDVVDPTSTHIYLYMFYAGELIDMCGVMRSI